ncbi:MAG: hypothetical protein U0800_20800 [Isosphaeraceae bacterium]
MPTDPSQVPLILPLSDATSQTPPFAVAGPPASVAATEKLTTDRWIGASAEAGTVVLRDPRLFTASRAGFCRALVAAALAEDGDGLLRSVRIDAKDFSCRFAFEPGRLPMPELASRVHRAIHVATTAAAEATAPSATAWMGLAVGSTRLVVEAGSAHGGRVRLRLRFVRGGPVRLNLGVRAWSGAWSDRITINSKGRGTSRLLDCLELEFRRSAGGPIEVADARRPRDLLLAGGALTVAAIGFAMPGFPGLPFLVVGGNALMRCSPRLARRLHGLPILGRRIRSGVSTRLDQRFWLKTAASVAAIVLVLMLLKPPALLVTAYELGTLGISLLRPEATSCAA